MHVYVWKHIVSLLLQNHSMDIYETWWGYCAHGPLQLLLFFGQIRPGVD